MWRDKGSLSEEDALELIRPFTMEELERESIERLGFQFWSWPRRLTCWFYKEFWPEIKDTMLEMFNKLHEGSLNYSLISLILKLKEANNIKQYRPICLLNVDYKLFTKVSTLS